MPEVAGTNPFDVEGIIRKLALGIGEERARQVVSECMREARLAQLVSGDDLEKLAQRLIARGGFICIVGRSLMVDVIMLRRPELG